MTSPRNARQIGSSREYRWGNERYTGVTTILNRGTPKPALPRWSAKMVAEFVVAEIATVNQLVERSPKAAIDLMKGAPWRNSEAKADLGSNVHAAVEAYALGQPYPEYDKPVAPFVQIFEQQFLEQYEPEFVMTEATVYNRTIGYAGTLDGIMKFPSERVRRAFAQYGYRCTPDDLWLIDVKTGTGVYGEAALQMAAYANAEFVGLKTGEEVPMPAVHHAAVLHLRPRHFELYPMDISAETWLSFLAAVDVAQWMDRADECVGAPLPHPPPIREEDAARV